MDPFALSADRRYMYSIDSDLAYVEAMAGELKTYLLGKDLYWSLRGPGGVLPRGTLGGLFLRLHRLGALHGLLTDDQQMRLASAREVIQAELDRWIVQVEDKIKREVKARLNNWRIFLDELGNSPNRYLPDYRIQAEGRTIIYFLREYAGSALNGTGTTRTVMTLDRLLRAITEEDTFILDDVLLPAFPPSIFWWLYVTPVLKKK